MKKIFLYLLILISINVFAQDSIKQMRGGFNIFLEEDYFNPKFNEDRNYTGGGAINLTGKFSESKWFVIPLFRKKIDNLLRIERIFYDTENNTKYNLVSNSFSFGTSLFTPENIAITSPVVGDRPYASLTFISSKQTKIWGDYYHKNDNLAISTELNLGVLGTKIGDSVQTWIHRYYIKNKPSLNNRPLPKGWDNQISNGGEFTGMYRLTIQNKLGEVFWCKLKNIKAIQFSSLYECQLGYYTNLCLGLSLKVGMFKTNFWQTNSNFGNSFNQYEINNTHNSNSSKSGINKINFEQIITKKEHSLLKIIFNNVELYGFASGRSRLVGYNALLQGQFNKSVYTLNSNEINRMVNEFEIGVNLTIWRISLIFEPIVGRTSELNTNYSRTHIWGMGYFSFSLPLEIH